MVLNYFWLSVGRSLCNFFMSWASCSHSFMVPFAAWAPKAVPFIFLRRNPGGAGKDPTSPRRQSPWVTPSPELHLPMCLDESRLWPREAYVWETWNGQQMQNLASGNAWRRLRDDRLWKQGEAAHGGCGTDGGIRGELLGEEETWSKRYSLRMNISGTGWRLSRSEEKRFPCKGLVVQMGWKGQAAEAACVRQRARTEHKCREWSESLLVNIFKSSTYFSHQKPCSCSIMNYQSAVWRSAVRLYDCRNQPLDCKSMHLLKVNALL